MSFFSKLIFIIFPFIKRNLPQTYYKLIIKDNQSACIEANVSYEIAKRFDAKPGNCQSVGCNKFRGKQYIPFYCTVKGYVCSDVLSKIESN